MDKRITVAIIIILIMGIIFIVSNSGINMLVDLSLENLETKPWAPRLLFQSGSIAFWSLRYEKAIEVYGLFLEKIGIDNPFTGEASYRKALCHEKLFHNLDAVEEYYFFLDSFPTHPKVPSAEKSVKRITGI